MMNLIVDKEDKKYFNEKDVINKPYFESLRRELTCSICHGILDNPVMCSDCETYYCSYCIDKWIKNNNQCIMKCKGPFKPKNITRLMKNIMEKVFLTCEFCNGQTNLFDYSTHIKNCFENSKIINCPFCKDCKFTKGEVKDKEVDISNFHKLHQQIQEYKNKESQLMHVIKDKEKIINELNNDNEALRIIYKSKDIKIDCLQKQINLMSENKEGNNDLILFKNGGVYKIIRKPCNHFPNKGYVTVYRCCNKPYNCYKCHNDIEKHELDFDKFQRGYCLDCRIWFEQTENTTSCLGCGQDFQISK